MHFQMICLLGKLQNLKVCVLKLFFFYGPANLGHPVKLSYYNIYEEFSRTRTIDLFIQRCQTRIRVIPYILYYKVYNSNGC